jgi:molybdopterin synthase catalytic subunit
MSEIKVLFFATLRDRAGVRDTSFDLPQDATVADLKARLSDTYPALREALGSALVSVNHQFAFDDEALPAQAEVAIFPPVSGGSDFPTIFAITEDALDLDDLLDRITLTATGAACVFTGMVRGQTERDNPHQTIYLEYEAYQPMAEAKMRQVADEIRARWPAVQGIAIVQRIGRLEPRTPPHTATPAYSKPPAMASTVSKKSSRSGRKKSAQTANNGLRAIITRRRMIRTCIQNFQFAIGPYKWFS